MRRAAACWFVMATLCGVRGGEGHDLDTVWLVPADRFGPYVSAEQRRPRVWVVSARSQLAGFGDLPQTSLAVGFGHALRGQLAWQRTGRGGTPWAEHRWRGRFRWSSWPVALIGSYRSAEAEGRPWPPGWRVDLVPVVESAHGMRLEARLPLVVEERSWTSWGDDPGLSFTLRSGGVLLSLASVDGPMGTSSLRFQGWVRRWDGVALGVGRSGASGEVALLFAVTRGGLLIRSRHAVHALLGVTHLWQVGWLGSVGP